MSYYHYSYGSQPPPPYSEENPSSSWDYEEYQPYYENGTLMIPVEVPDDSAAPHVTRVYYVTTPKPKVTHAKNDKKHRSTPARTVTNYVTVTAPPVKTVTHIITAPTVQGRQNRAGPVISDPPGVEWVGVDPMSADNLAGRAVVGGNYVENNCSYSRYYSYNSGLNQTKSYPLWIMRAWKDGNLIPGRLSASQKSALIPYNGKGFEVHETEVLCAKPEMLRWEATSLGNVPPGAIPGGVTADGETLYIGRASHENSKIPGKVQPSNKCCYIVYGSQEISKSTYEVLVSK